MIFTTAYRDYAIQGFELNAVDYLLKPVVFERFFKATEKFIESVRPTAPVDKKISESNVSVYVQSNRKNIKITLADVLYVESVKDYVHVHLANSKLILKYGISAFEELLDSRFVRVHRSYLVNKDSVTAFTKTDVEINNTQIPIGEFYKERALVKLL